MNKQKESYKLFQKQLIIGQYWELQAQKVIIKYLKESVHVIEICNDYKYDFRLSNNITYECKMNSNRLNIFVEYLQFGRPSGLSITQADYYIFIIPNTMSDYFLLIQIDDLKELIKKKMYKKNYVDEFKSGYIIDYHILVKYAVDINQTE
jgi:hypothetical protein